MTLGYARSAYYGAQAIEVLKATRVSDGQGGWTQSWPVNATIRGHLMPQTGRRQREQRISGQETALITHRAYLPGSTDVNNEDRLRSGGVDYRVIAVMSSGGFGRWFVCDLLEVT